MKKSKLADHLINNFKLGKESLHGPRHWEKVLQNGMEISEMNPNIDADVVRLFSIIHDSKRENESIDIEHGMRAAESISRLEELGLLTITSEQREKLYYACQHHTNGKTSSDLTIGTCWDADRLELYRVRIIPEAAYFSTEEGKSILANRYN